METDEFFTIKEKDLLFSLYRKLLQLSGETLQNSGASDIRELNQVAPSLLVSSTGNEANGSARIRGIGTVGDNPGLESSVAVFIDGVYRSRKCGLRFANQIVR